jgi:hypothetical protein
MKTGTFPETFRLMKERFRKSGRIWIILFWYLGAKITCITLWYLSILYLINIGSYPTNENSLSTLKYVTFVCILGVPSCFLILGLLGVLPGTRRKEGSL